MKTVIFILALTAIAAPVFTAAEDPIACTANPTNCNMCIADANGATTACFDCKAGYYLNYNSATTGTCTRCGTGKGAAAGTATAATPKASRPASASACTVDCHASCLNCLVGATANSCTNCKDGMWANAFANGASTCTVCTNGKGRTAPATNANDLTAAEVEATVCAVTCATGAANCKGTAATDALYCAANYWLSTNTCTACDMGKAKAASTAVPTTAETAASCAICAKDTYYTATGCTNCPAGKTRTAPTEAPKAVETDAACTAAGGSGSSATLIQALCGASVAAYALF